MCEYLHVCCFHVCTAAPCRLLIGDALTVFYRPYSTGVTHYVFLVASYSFIIIMSGKRVIGSTAR